MRCFILILTLFFYGCGSTSSNDISFDDLSTAFIKWYYKSNPTQASKVNLLSYNGEFRMNNYKSNEQYLLDLNRFYFELTQINYNKMSKVKKKEYNRLEKFMLKLLYQEENIKAAQWTPIFEIIQVERGLRYLLNYNYISMKNKMSNIGMRLDRVNQILDNSLTNLFFIAVKDYNQSVKEIDLIIDLLESIDIRLDSADPNYETIVDKSKDVILRLKKYKKELLGANRDFENFDQEYIVNNNSFSVMTEFDVDINSIYNRAVSNLRTEQIKLFKNCLPIYLTYEDEPIWVDYEDTLSVVKYVIDDIEKKAQITDFSYVEESYRKNILSEFDFIKFNYYNDFSDISYLNENLDIVTPNDLNDKLHVNLPQDLKTSMKYNKFDIDLLNAHNIYPGYLYLLYSNNEPFKDLNKNGIWDENERFTDINANKEYDKATSIVQNFPNMSMLRGAQRYSERVFLKTNSSIRKEHEILHQRNLIVDMLSCISDINYHLNNMSVKDIEYSLRQNSFLHDIEIVNLIDKLESNYFGCLSQKYIGYSNIMELERKYFSNNIKDYLLFYNQTFQYGLLDYENL